MILFAFFCRTDAGQEFTALEEKVDLGLEGDLTVLQCYLVDLLEVLIDQLHIGLIEHDVDKTEQFDFLVGFDELRVLVVNIPLELSVEV
jgi:hypothetical protein